MRSTSRSKGFTYVEMLVTLAVLAALASAGVPRIRGMKERSYAATMKATLQQVRLAEESYFVDHGVYTTNAQDLELRQSARVIVSITSSNPVAGWRAVAVHATSPQTCSTGIGSDAQLNERAGIVCQ